MIIGIDCAEPSLVLERWRDRLPVLSGLIERGRCGRLTSVVPPITVPAWSSMMAGRSPGDLGIYGFRNRADHSYDELFIANGDAVTAPRLWDLATRFGKPSIVIGVPGTYPPRPLNGVMVSCFLTPSTESEYTYPSMLRREIELLVGEYLFDCTNFRTDDKDDLLRQVYEMTDRRFALATHLLDTKPWDLFVMVEMGVDRIQHGFWRALDELHRGYEPASPYADAILDYHVHLDALIGGLLERADDETTVLVVSDHGAKRMDGGIRINEWLRQEGYLNTLTEPTEVVSLAEAGVDWSRTIAWGEGGYYGRVFLNVRGREPEGIVDPVDYERVRAELVARLQEIRDDRGTPLETVAHRPEDLYEEVNGVAPDLIVLFGDLYWRAVGTVGGGAGIHTVENDTGLDDANHAQDGLLIMAGPGVDHGPITGAQLLDVAPTVLDVLGIDIPQATRGTSLVAIDASAARAG
jgi:predicted AlkP superfamily phosphohydrolase/phosphomutase